MVRKRKNDSTIQAAMEFILSYGWAILIIIGILGIFYSLGYFGTQDFTPRVQPGACYVYRPNGPYSTEQLTLVGACNNELPAFVVGFETKNTSWNFNCASEGSCVGLNDILSPYGQPNSIVCNLTVTEWSYDIDMPANGSVKTLTYGNWSAGVGAVPSVPALGGVFSLYNISSSGQPVPTAGAINVEYNNTLIRYEMRNNTVRNQVFFQGNFKDVWMQTGIVLNNGVAYAYMNGKLISPPSNNIGCVRIVNGTLGLWDRNFYGEISNLQVYDRALSTNDLAALYAEGIGGPPIQLTSLIAWYPLDGNANDYSGNGHNGNRVNISALGGWASSYTTP